MINKIKIEAHDEDGHIFSIEQLVDNKHLESSFDRVVYRAKESIKRMMKESRSEEKTRPNRTLSAFLSEEDMHLLQSGHTLIQRFISENSDITVRIYLEGNNQDLEEENNKNE